MYNICIYMYRYMHIKYLKTYIHVHVYTTVYVYTCIYMYKCAYIHVHIYTYTCICTQYIYAHIGRHRYIQRILL